MGQSVTEDWTNTERSLMSSSDPFQEIVDQLKRTFTIMNTATATTSITSTTSSSTSSPGMVSPMVRPAPYSGRAEECNGFLLQCSLTFEMQPQLFPTERAKIAFIISLLQGKAPISVSSHAVWTSQRPLRIPGFHARGTPGVSPSIRSRLHR